MACDIVALKSIYFRQLSLSAEIQMYNPAAIVFARRVHDKTIAFKLSTLFTRALCQKVKSA